MGKGVRLKEADIGGIVYLSKEKNSSTYIALQTGIPEEKFNTAATCSMTELDPFDSKYLCGTTKTLIIF